MTDSPYRAPDESVSSSLLSSHAPELLTEKNHPLVLAQFRPGAENQGSAQQLSPGLIQASGRVERQSNLTQIDYYRERLKAEGINPDKVSSRIVVRELDSPDPKDTMAAWHAGTVACSINDPELGLSRNLKIAMVNDQPADDPKGAEFPETLQAAVIENAARTVAEFTKTLREQFLNTDNPARILNVSNGGSAVDQALSLYGLLAENPQRYADTIRQMLGAQKGNAWIKEQIAKPNKEAEEEAPVRLTEKQLEEIRQGKCLDLRRAPVNISAEMPKHPQLLQKLIELTEKTLAQSGEFQRSLEVYRDTTRQIADKGGIIVVAAGNNGDFAQQHSVRLNPGAEYNWLALSDHVISVGASADRGKRGIPQDDRPAAFSSSGTSRYSPTVLALGENFPTRLHPSGKIDGTSYAAPLVANVIGLMLEQDPSLGFAQVRDILKENSQKVSGFPLEKQGSGILHIDKAVLAARAGAKGK